MHFQVLGYQSFCLSNSRNIIFMVIDITIIIRFSNFWPTLSGNVILKGMFRKFLKVLVFSCCFTVDSCHKTLMSGVKES